MENGKNDVVDQAQETSGYPCKSCHSYQTVKIGERWVPLYKYTRYGRQQVGERLDDLLECADCSMVSSWSFEDKLRHDRKYAEVE